MIKGYCRISTKGQLDGNSLEEQQNKILDKYPNAIIFQEQYSGAKIDRPVFSKLIDELETGDTLVVTKLDRFCRSTKEGLDVIDKLMKKGVSIHILNMGLIEDTAMGKLIVTNLLAFAEFERAMIIERTQSGKAIAKTKQGFKEGRPKKFTNHQLDYAMSLLKENSFSKVAELTNISIATLKRESAKRKAKELGK